MKALRRRYQASSIRFRVVAGAFILGALLVIVAVQATVRASEDGLRRQFADRTETLVGAVATMSEAPLITARYAQHNELLKQLSGGQDIRILDLVDTAGQVVSSSDQARVGLESTSPIARLDVDDQHPVINEPVITASGEIGTVWAVLDTTAVERLLTAERRRGLVSGIVGVSVVALVSLLGGWALTRRVSDLESQLGSVDENGLPDLVRTTGNDEIARLGAALNHRTLQTREVLRAIERSRTAVQLSESKLQMALGTAADAVFEMDLTAGGIEILNATTTGRIMRDLATADVRALQEGIHPDDRGLIQQAGLRAMSGSAPPTGIDELEIRFNTDRQGWRDLLVRLKVVDNATGSATRLLVAIVDVTEQRLTARHLARSEKMRTIGLLTAGIAHDFNNALAVSRLQLSVLRHGDRDRSRDDERIEQLILSNDNASEIVRRLLVSAAPQPAIPKRINVADFIKSLGGLLGTILGPDIALTLNSMADDDTVEIDEAATQHVFFNLAKNAVDAMDGVGHLTIRTFNPSESTVAIEITDTGLGIDPEVTESLFDPFVTTKPAGAGTGLGLATALQTVTAAGGTLTASNDPAGGASFTVTLPLAEPCSPEATVDIPGWEADLPGSGRILLVDDNTALLDELTQLLVANGYDVSAAACCDDAMRLVTESNGFDLIFTDIALPDGSGFDLGRQVAQLKPGIRIVYVSAIPPMIDAVSPDDIVFLQKPFDDASVLSTVASALLASPTAP